MKPLFKSDVLQQQFETDGFVQLKLISREDANLLLQEYEKVSEAHQRINIPYITTSHSNNPELIQHVDNVLQKVLAPALDQVLSNYKLLFGNYLIKMPGIGSETEPHQDITFVDESKYTSVNVWVALQNTTPENGCMYFLPGSHRFATTIRPTHNYKWMYENVKEQIKGASKVFPAKAGDAFIFNHAVIHGSFENNTSEPRIAAVVAAYNSDAPLIHYYLPEIDKNRLQKFSMDKEAYLHFTKHQPPAKGVYLEDEYFEFKQLSEAEFVAISGGGNSRGALINRICSWFRNVKTSFNE